MDKTYYRLIFTGLRKDIHPDKLVSCLKDSLGYSEVKIRSVLTSPPRVLTLSEEEEQIYRVRHQIESVGGRTIIDSMVDDPQCPFPLSKKNNKRIRHEIAKASQGEWPFALISVKLIPESDQIVLPSLLEGFEDKIEEQLKRCVTVLPVDDSRLILLDYYSDQTSGLKTMEQLDDILDGLIGESGKIFRGMAVYPENGKDVSDLLKVAEKNTKVMISRARTSDEQVDDGRLSLGNIIKDSESASDLYQQMLISARGKKFKWLIEQDVDTLWLGLGSLPQVRQWEFLYRMPLTSNLVSGIEKAIISRKKSVSGTDTQQRIDELLIKLCSFDNDERFAPLRQEIPQKLKNVKSFPTLSKVAMTIASIARNPDSGIDALTSVIKNDPSLTLTLLKIVNSAFYGFPQQIETIERAVIILGRDELVNLSLGLSASRAIDAATTHGLYKPQELWHHLMGTALICRYLYKRYEKKDEPGLFTAGLLHDFGKIFLVENYPEAYDKIHLDAEEFNIPLYELEEECFGINHAVIGKYIGSNWNLPEHLVQGAAYHHQPFFATEHTSLAAIIGFADYLYHMACPSDVSKVVSSCSPWLTYGHWHIIKGVFPGIQQEDIGTLVSESEAFIKENNQIFSVLK